MGKYYSNYAATHDIDCFFRIGSIPYHFASNGHQIPDFIDLSSNREIQAEVYGIPDNDRIEVDIHEENINEFLNRMLSRIESPESDAYDSRDTEQIRHDYISSFQSMSRKGFISMDTDAFEEYRIIASPKNTTSLPDKILHKLPNIEGYKLTIKE